MGAVAVKAHSSTGSGLVLLPRVQREKAAMSVLVTMFGPKVPGRCGTQGPAGVATDLNRTRLATGMPLSSWSK